jgi:hypothetical protein
MVAQSTLIVVCKSLFVVVVLVTPTSAVRFCTSQQRQLPRFLILLLLIVRLESITCFLIMVMVRFTSTNHAPPAFCGTTSPSVKLSITGLLSLLTNQVHNGEHPSSLWLGSSVTQGLIPAVHCFRRLTMATFITAVELVQAERFSMEGTME